MRRLAYIIIAIASASCLQDNLVRCANGRACPIGSSCIADPAAEGPFCTSTTCGNGVIEPGIEDCEPEGVTVETCSSFGFYTGTLRCNPSTCRFDVTDCAGRCGDGVHDDGYEQCDIGVPIQTGCTSLSGQFAWGRPSCTAACTFDASPCVTVGFESRFEGTTPIRRFCAYEEAGEVIAYVPQGTGVSRVSSAGVVPLPGAASQPIHDLACNANEIFLASYGLFRHDYVGSGWQQVTLPGIPDETRIHDLAAFGSEFGGVGYGSSIVTGSGTTWTRERHDAGMVRLVAATFTSDGNATAVAQSGEFYVRAPATGTWIESVDSQLIGAMAWMWSDASTTLVATRSLTTNRLFRRASPWTKEQDIGGPLAGLRADSLFLGHQDGLLRHFDGHVWSTALEATSVFDELWVASDGAIWGAAGAELLRAEHLWFASAGGERQRIPAPPHLWVLTAGQLLRDGVVQPSPPSVLHRIAVAGTVVFGVGSNSLTTHYAGRLDTGAASPSWTSVTGIPVMRGIVAIDATHAVAVGDNGSAIATGSPHSLLALERTPAGELIAVGDAGTIVTSLDGTTWTVVDHGLAIDAALRAVWAAPDGTVHVVGDRGTILRRTGSQWERMASPVMLDLTVIAGSSPSSIFAAGQLALLRFDGEVWTRMRSPIGGSVFTSLALSTDHLYASTASQTFVLYRP